MQTVFDLVKEAQALRCQGLEVLAVEYFSKSNRSNRHYVILRNDQEFNQLKSLYSDWDYQFNLIHC